MLWELPPTSSQGWIFEGPDRTCIYLPVSEANAKQGGQMFVLFRGSEGAGLRHLRERMAALWPDFAGDTVPMSAVLSLQIYPFRAAAWIGWVLGLVAMVLSVSGMYGVLTYLVNQRSKEIGIRMALGASPSGVVALVLRRSLWLAGLRRNDRRRAGRRRGEAPVVVERGLGVFTWDNVALLAGAGLAGGAAVLAAVGPSSRAAHVDLRHRAAQRLDPRAVNLFDFGVPPWPRPIRAATVKERGILPQ